MGLARKKMTREQYLALEPEEGVKYEWINGEMYAMSGGTPLHAAVTLNIGASLHLKLRGKPCRPSSPDQRLFVQASDATFFPDAMVICPPWKMVEGDVQSVTNPTVVIEVLSPSTISYDRGAKFEHYRLVPSVTDCLFVDPKQRSVTQLTRTETGWARRDFESGSVELASIRVDLELTDIFADLEHVPDAE